MREKPLNLTVIIYSFWQHKPVRFLFTGALNTLFGYSLFAFLIWFGCHYTMACLIGTIAGIFFNFKTIGTLVFGESDYRLLTRFILIYSLHYTISICLLTLGFYVTANIYLNGIIVTFMMALVSYQLYKQLVFTRSPYETN